MPSPFVIPHSPTSFLRLPQSSAWAQLSHSPSHSRTGCPQRLAFKSPFPISTHPSDSLSVFVHISHTLGRTANELSTSCVYSKKDWVRIASLGQDDDEALDDELHKKPDPEWEKTGRQTCSKNHGLCYTLWQEVPTVNVTSSKNATTPTVVILAQGE